MKDKSFATWLKENTNLMQRTISLYVRTINYFNDKHDEPSTANINKFITESFRKKHSFYMKYAFKYYLEYLDRPADYNMLVKVKTRPRKKEGCYLSKEELLKIVEGVEDNTYRMVALVQYLTGARAHDVLGFDIKNTEEKKDGSLDLRLLPKGERKIHIARIPVSCANRIKRFLRKGKVKHPFLHVDSYRGFELVAAVNNNYSYYHQAIKKSAIACGHPKFATHDFRRNFIDDVYKLTKDARVAADAVGVSVETAMKYIQKRADQKEVNGVLKRVRG